jgi:uncharacterized protein (TIGR02569 family)
VRPPDRVLTAFGCRVEPVPLPGGEGRTWRAGEIVLKPVDEEGEAAWVAELLSTLRADGFRVPRPIRAGDGRWVVDGWTAWQRVEGEHEPRWGDVIRAGEAFHRALEGVPRPTFLDRRTNQWATGDRVAWGELPLDDYVHMKHLPELAAALRPLDLPAQLIHGDLTGNVLFAPGLPPAVIDFSPYWRPPAFASAIVVADALVWEGADESVLHEVAHVEHFDQLFVRALIYRKVTDRIARAGEPERDDDADPYLPIVRLARRLSGA